MKNDCCIDGGGWRCLFMNPAAGAGLNFPWAPPTATVAPGLDIKLKLRFHPPF